MTYTATYYKTLCINTETWHWIHEHVVIATQTQIIDIIPYKIYKKTYASLELIEKKGHHIPAFVNAHTHLDNAYLYGKTVKHQGFYTWLCSVLQHRKEDTYVQKYITSTPQSIMVQDTAYIASIASSEWLHTLLIGRSIPHCVFYESIGKNMLTPKLHHTQSLYNMSFAGHALYSTQSNILQYVKSLCRKYQRPFSIHLAEHEEEYEFLQGVNNEFSHLLQKRLMPYYIPPRKSPVEYAHSLGLLDKNTLAVHCVHCSRKDIQLLQESKTTICLCPRSNTYIGVGKAKAKDFYQAGIPLCIATDGLASNTSLSMWEEADYAMNIYGFTLRECIPMMTIQPARILGVDNIFGKIQPGYYPMTTEIPQQYLE